MRRVVAALAATAFTVLPSAPAGAQFEEPGFRMATVARLDFPTGLQFTRSGRDLFVNEREGRIRIIREGRLLERPFATVRTTLEGEGGLLGLALHPRFEDGEPWVYIFRTLPDGSADVVERLRADGDRAARRETVMELPGQTAAYHHGGVLEFGPDGKLYVSHGESHESDRAQNPRTLGGKIYRLEPDGSIPGDNPFDGRPTWAYGIRNPFGLAFDPETDLLWESENGPRANDEINLIEPARNYGWPVVQGKAGDDRFEEPKVDYVDIIVPTMMAFAGDRFGAEYRGNLFLGTFGERSIRRLVLSADRRDVDSDTVFLRTGEGVVGMHWRDRDGLYFTTPTRVMRIRPVKPPASPSPTAAPTTPPAAPSPPAGDGASRWPWIGLGAAGVAVAAGAALLARRGR